jgi:chaperonin GroES
LAGRRRALGGPETLFLNPRLDPGRTRAYIAAHFGIRALRVPRCGIDRSAREACSPDPPNPLSSGATPWGSAPGGPGYMKIRPLQDRILVKRIEEEETTKGGIIIPDTAKEKPQEGKIVAVGKGKVAEDGKVTPLDVKKGDKILFSKYAGTEVNIEGEEHLIIREDDVLGVVE